MEPKKINFEDLKDLNYGDQIILDDPLKGHGASYVFMSNIENKKFYFISDYGASLLIDNQKTIDGFNVSLIDKDHPSWNEKLSDHGIQLGEMLDKFACMDEQEIGSALHGMLDKGI